MQSSCGFIVLLLVLLIIFSAPQPFDGSAPNADASSQTACEDAVTLNDTASENRAAAIITIIIAIIIALLIISNCEVNACWK